MRYKVVPPVRDLAFLREVAGALPLVPGTVDDCCARIVDRTDVPARDDAREWLTFCQALGLAAETDRGFHRVREEPDEAAIADAFREQIFGAREVLAAVEDGEGTTAEAGFQALRDEIPQWERSRGEDWEATWRERIGRLLGWAVVLGLLKREDDDSWRRSG
ncbi:MAG: hypothetical protein V5A43_08680 [Haloarculaceae archaeon]